MDDDVEILLAIRERLRPADREDVRTVGRIVSRNLIEPKREDEKYDEFITRVVEEMRARI